MDDKQELAINASEQFIFLLAGAGSGKTTVVVNKIHKLIKEGVEPNKILAISFTRKAAKELTIRLNYDLIISVTFHKLCYDLLGAQSVFNNEQSIFTKEQLLQVSKYKNSNFSIKKPLIYEEYQMILEEDNANDFDDILLNIIKSNTSFEYDYIFVDEFQDTNELQYTLLRKMVNKNTKVFCVGDPDQSIYKFRGANLKIINRFIRDFNAKTYLLDYNYRSSNEVTTISNNLIKNNKNRIKKNLIPKNNQSYRQEIYIVDTSSYYDYIVKICKKYPNTQILYRDYYDCLYLKHFLRQKYIFNINLMSIHQAKGLEFDNVLLINNKPDSLHKTQEDLEEERRIWFVGLTRAKKRVIIVSTCLTKFIKELKYSYIKVKEKGLK